MTIPELWYSLNAFHGNVKPEKSDFGEAAEPAAPRFNSAWNRGIYTIRSCDLLKNNGPSLTGRVS